MMTFAASQFRCECDVNGFTLPMKILCECVAKKVFEKKSEPPAAIVLAIQGESASVRKAMEFVMTHFIDMGYIARHTNVSERAFQLKFICFFREARQSRNDWFALGCAAKCCTLQSCEVTFGNLYLHTWWKLTKSHIRVLIAFSMHVADCDPPTDRKCVRHLMLIRFN